MSVSIIIPAFNEENYISACLESLRGQKAEIIVVDSSTDDKTSEIAKRFETKIIRLPKATVGKAKNAGVSQATSEIVAFMDADTVAPPNWVEMVTHSLRDGVVGVTGVKRPLNGLWYDEIILPIIYYLQGISSTLNIPLEVCTNSAIRRDVFLSIGGFDEKREYGEGQPITYNIHKYGRTKFNPKMVVHTSMRRTRKWGWHKIIINNTLSWIINNNNKYVKIR